MSSREVGHSGAGRGLFQLTDAARKTAFKQWSGGTPIERASQDQQIRFAIYELSHNERGGWAKAQKLGTDAASLAEGYCRYVERPKFPHQDGADRANIAAAMDRIPPR